MRHVQVDEGVRVVLALFQQTLEELTSRAEDHLVRLDLLTITADQGDITEVRVLEQTSDCISGESVEVGSFESQPHVFHFIRLNELNEYNDFAQAELEVFIYQPI